MSGRVTPDTGIWEDYLRKIPGEARVEVVPPGHPEGRLAVLHYRTLATADWGSWLEIQLETGRTHQVRIQAAARGHPLLGDAHYGSTVPFGPQYEDHRLRAIALHARSLEFRHPGTKEMVAVTARLGRSGTIFCRLRFCNEMRKYFKVIAASGFAMNCENTPGNSLYRTKSHQVAFAVATLAVRDKI